LTNEVVALKKKLKENYHENHAVERLIEIAEVI